MLSHTVHHGLVHPHGVRDILGVLRVEQGILDWTVLTEYARAWRVSVAVWAALSVARITNYELRITNQEEDLIPEWALEALRVPRWRQWALRPFVRRAAGGRAVLVSGTMRFLGVLVVDRVCDLPGVVLRGLFPGKRWLQLRYDLTSRQAFWRQFTYPLEVLARGVGALTQAMMHHSSFALRYFPFTLR